MPNFAHSIRNRGSRLRVETHLHSVIVAVIGLIFNKLTHARQLFVTDVPTEFPKNPTDVLSL